MTKDLLHLIQEFPQAFADPESPAENSESQSTASLQAANLPAVNKTWLLDLIQEFPQAFADPEAPLAASTSRGAVVAEDNLTEPALAAPLQANPLPHLPAGYACALRRRVPTFTWGQVDFNLTYEANGLAAIWITVGKSGTEVQSLCEAIARLINLLLAQHVPIPEIIREVRGIRGADSEGLGPNRVLGLADLVGKVLQEAPAHWGAISTPAQRLPDEPPTTLEATPDHEPQIVPEDSASRAALAEMESPWGIAEPVGTSASLCPECGAELSQVNGCKGGACVVCGYSSCS